MSNIQLTDCPYYEEHGGEYYQGMWQYTDGCMFSQLDSSYKIDCFSNNCWYRRKEANKEILEICKKYFEPSKEYDYHNNRWITYESKCEQVKDNYVKHIQTILQTLEE